LDHYLRNGDEELNSGLYENEDSSALGEASGQAKYVNICNNSFLVSAKFQKWI